MFEHTEWKLVHVLQQFLTIPLLLAFHIETYRHDDDDDDDDDYEDDDYMRIAPSQTYP